MSDHLPECPVPAMEARHGPLHPEDAEANCICTELRACEERVREEWYGAQSEAWGRGFLYALDEAREVVAALRYHLSLPIDDTVIYRTDAIAAIDALREGSK